MKMISSWNDLVASMLVAKDALQASNRAYIILAKDLESNASMTAFSEMDDNCKLLLASELRKIADQLSKL